MSNLECPRCKCNSLYVSTDDKDGNFYYRCSRGSCKKLFMRKKDKFVEVKNEKN